MFGAGLTLVAFLLHGSGNQVSKSYGGNMRLNMFKK